MAQAGYTPISLYYSTTALAVPVNTNLVNGELAINITDGKLYYKDNSGVVQLIASKAGASGDVVGPASSTTNAIPTFADTTGKLLQNNSGVTISSNTVTASGGFSTAANLTFTGTGNRITGDFSNATISNWAGFQSSTTNGQTNIPAIPNGTATVSSFSAFGGSDVDNSVYIGIQGRAAEARIVSTKSGTASYAPLTMYTGGSERLRIDTNGVVDIGGTSGGSVGERLVVEGANSAGHRSARINNTSTTNGYSTLWLGSSNDGVLRGGSTASAFTDQLALLTSGANPITLYTNNTERMRIDANGKIGINGSPQTGVSAQVEVLQVLGTDGATSTAAVKRYSADTASPNLRTYKSRASSIGTDTIVQSGDGVGAWTGYGYDGSGYTNAAQIRMDVDGTPGANDMPGRITFSTTADGASALTERMRIDSSGNVGIGTSSPSSPLNVVSASSSLAIAINGRSSDSLGAMYFYANNGSTQYSTITASATEFRLSSIPAAAVQTFYTNGSERMRIDASGNVQVGTTTSAGKVRFYQTADAPTLTLTSDQSGYLSSNQAVLNIVTTNGTSNPTTSFAISTAYNGNTLFNVRNDGNVGIGNNNPQAKLHVGSVTTAPGFGTVSEMVYITGATQPEFLVRQTTDSVVCSIAADVNGGYVRTATNHPLLFYTNNNERMRITSVGEVYIAGTTDQGAYNLQCNGTGVWGAGAYVNGSDERIKDNIAPLDSGLDVVAKLNPVTYKYKENWSKDQSTQTGFIAQELLTALDGKNYVDGVVQQGGEYMSVAYQNIIPILTKAIQEQQAMIEELKQEVAKLKGV